MTLSSWLLWDSGPLILVFPLVLGCLSVVFLPVPSQYNSRCQHTGLSKIIKSIWNTTLMQVFDCHVTAPVTICLRNTSYTCSGQAPWVPHLLSATVKAVCSLKLVGSVSQNLSSQAMMVPIIPYLPIIFKRDFLYRWSARYSILCLIIHFSLVTSIRQRWIYTSLDIMD